jgi:hypothetical protein
MGTSVVIVISGDADPERQIAVDRPRQRTRKGRSRAEISSSVAIAGVRPLAAF